MSDVQHATVGDVVTVTGKVLENSVFWIKIHEISSCSIVKPASSFKTGDFVFVSRAGVEKKIGKITDAEKLSSNPNSHKYFVEFDDVNLWCWANEIILATDEQVVAYIQAQKEKRVAEKMRRISLATQDFTPEELVTVGQMLITNGQEKNIK